MLSTVSSLFLEMDAQVSHLPLFVLLLPQIAQDLIKVLLSI